MDRTVLVTGADRGLGFALSPDCSKEAGTFLPVSTYQNGMS